MAKQFDEPEYPRIPLHLPPVSPFGLDVLDDWIDMVMAMESMRIPTGLTAKILLEKTGRLDGAVSRFIAAVGGNGTTGRTIENNQCILFSRLP
ncbi:hypothetical protein LC613_37325 [Nostoc sphaeroides CHAB 2801]|uniref:hypothetical protein n=1 Tax=Nostoc sphaeroides TaxID=446679 RepID=UPI001E3E5D70|nr:hypothetical protein [Nostoc sphaeroides]MCC5633172.1 hypothetical protein [Nostoc sphaeroides CHAB 2801]